MIIFTAPLCLIFTVVVVLAGVATSSGSIHSLGGHFVLSGHQLSSLSAGKPFRSSIVVRIAALLAWTAAGSPANPSSAREPTSGGLGDVMHAAAAAKQAS